MSTFTPIDFAYLPYMRPEPVTAPPPLEPGGTPQHVEQMPASIRAAYVRDTAGFVDAYSASCGEWMKRVPEYVKSHEQLLPAAATVKAASGAPPLQLLEAAPPLEAAEADDWAASRSRRARGGKK